MARTPTIHLFERRGIRGKRWYFRFVASNGEIVANSEAYVNHQDAVDTALLVRDGFHGAPVVDKGA